MKIITFLLILLSSFAFAQEATSDPFAATQNAISEKLNQEWAKITDGCNTLVRPPIETKEDVNRYLDCIYGNLPNYIRFWASENQLALTTVQQALVEIAAQNSPEAETTAGERQSLMRITAFGHQKLTAWHQSMADMINTFGSQKYFSQKEVEETLSVIQESYTSCSVAAQKLLSELKEEASIGKEDVRKLMQTGIEGMFASTEDVLEKEQIVLLNVTKRSERHYPSFLNREGTEYRSFVAGYDSLFDMIFVTLDSCAKTLLEQKQQ